MSQPESWTIGRLLAWTTEYLSKSGSASPRLDAEILLAHARNCERIELYTAFDTEPDEAIRNQYRELVKQRHQGTPVAYLVGYKEFYSLEFEVNESVLIPRPETEHLVIETLDRIKNHTGQPPRIIDVGTGSGAVAISLAKHCAAASIVAVDISEEALTVARSNALKHGVDAQIEFQKADLLTGFDGKEKFDFVVSNPPYISDSEFESLEQSVKDFEPHLALVGGPGGGEIIDSLVSQATNVLKPGGVLLFEFSPMLRGRADDWFVEPWRECEIKKDLAGHDRIVIMEFGN